MGKTEGIIKITVAENIKEIQKIAPTWNRLFENTSSDNFFLSSAWSLKWLKYFGRDSHPLVLMATSEGRPIAIAPLMISKGGITSAGRSVVTFLGSDSAADYMDLLIDASDPSATMAVTKLLLTSRRNYSWDRMEMRRLLGNSDSIEIIESAGKSIGFFSRIYPVSQSPRVILPDTWDDYYSTRRRNLKNNLNRMHNGLARDGLVARFFVSQPSEIDRHLDTLVHLHLNRQRSKVGPSLFADPRWIGFARELLSSAETRDFFEISGIEIGGEIASVAIGVTNRATYYWWIPTINQSYAHRSVGKLHIESLIRRCIEQGFKVFDFTIGLEEYKLQWSNDIIGSDELVLYRNKSTEIVDAFARRSRSAIVNTIIRSPITSAVRVRWSRMTQRR